MYANFGNIKGTSGLTLWQIGETHYHFVVGWSAPRNFYTHSNTVMFGVTSGKPIQIEEGGGYGALFNHMYQSTAGSSSDDPHTFFVKTVCNFGERAKEGSFTDNRFSIGARLAQDHKHWSTVCIRDVAPAAVYSTREPTAAASGEEQEEATFENASVKLITHYYQTNWRKMQHGVAEEDEKSHVALVVETNKRSVYGGRINSVWLCELSGKEGGKSDVTLREAARVTCEEIGSTTSGLAAERKKLGLKCYNMGSVQLNTDDLVYAARTIGVEFKGAADFSDRNLKWIQCLASRLNLKNQDVIAQARENIVRARKAAAENDMAETFAMAGAEFGMAPAGFVFNGMAWPSTIVANEKLASSECEL